MPPPDHAPWAALGAIVYALIIGLTLWCWHGDALHRRWREWRARRWERRSDIRFGGRRH